MTNAAQELEELLADQAAQERPYELQRLVLALPVDERAAALDQAAARCGQGREWTLARFKAAHAMGLVLGKPVRQFTAGRHAFFMNTSARLTWLNRGMYCARVEHMFGSADDTQTAWEEEGHAGAFDEPRWDGFLATGLQYHRHAEAESLEALLHTVHVGDGVHDDDWLQAHDHYHRALSKGWDPLEDDEQRMHDAPRIRDIPETEVFVRALMLSGALQELALTRSGEEFSGTETILAENRGWSFVCGWRSPQADRTHAWAILGEGPAVTHFGPRGQPL